MANADDTEKPFCWDGDHEIEGPYVTCSRCPRKICEDHDLRSSPDELPLCKNDLRLQRERDESASTPMKFPGKPRPCNRGCGHMVFLSRRGDGVWRPYESWAAGYARRGEWKRHDCEATAEHLTARDLPDENSFEDLEETSWDDFIELPDDDSPTLAVPTSQDDDFFQGWVAALESENAALRQQVESHQQLVDSLRKQIELLRR